MPDQPTHLERGTVYPSEAAQARYPLADHWCARCESEHLPHLVDNRVEFYWEHQWRGSGRSGCPRFNRRKVRGDVPKEGTAHPTYYQGMHRDLFPDERTD